jgi:outer membrane lipoprotein SlyB
MFTSVLPTRCHSFVLPLLLAMSPAFAGEQQIKIYYGLVSAHRPVSVEDNTTTVALIGGLIGVAAFQGFSGSLAGDAIAGGAFGAGSGTALEKWGQSRVSGIQYDVTLVDGGSLQIVTDQEDIDIGDCVAVEADEEHANLRRVSTVHCAPANADWHDEGVHANAMKSAADCREAKRALLSADSAEEIEAAAKRAQALCDT